MRRILCLLPLPVSIAVSLPAIAVDEPLSWALCPAQTPLPGLENTPRSQLPDTTLRKQSPTTIEGDKLSGTSSTPTYQGNVALTRGDQFLGADQLHMDTDSGNYVAEGHVRYRDSAFRLVASRAEGNQDTDTHKVTDIKYQLVDRRGNGAAQSVDIQGQVGHLHHSTYTTCDPSQPIWQVDARQIDVDNNEGFGVAHHARLRLGHTQVMYVPWFKFPTDNRRLTGLLYPTIKISGKSGFNYIQPIYLNLAPNYDATVYPHFMSKRGVMLDNEFRYLYQRGAGTVYGSYLPDDKLSKTDRGRFQFSGYHNVDSHWQARAALNWISDMYYMEDFSRRLEGLSTASTLQSTVGMYYTGPTLGASISLDRWQLTDYSLDKTALPYNRMPRLLLDWQRPLASWLNVGVQAEAVHFNHDDSYAVVQVGSKYHYSNVVNREYNAGDRINLKPYLSLPFYGTAWYITPTIAWRYTSYNISLAQADRMQTGYRTPRRQLPITSVDAGLYFDRQTRVFTTDYLNTFEPRIYYLYVPYRNQQALPVFDTRASTFSWGTLFRDSRYSSADRQNDANQLTIAATSRWLQQDTGHEQLTLSAGQIFYLKNSRINLDPHSQNEFDHGRSAWVAGIGYNLDDRWTIGAAYQYNPTFRRKDLATLRMRYLFDHEGVINLAYRYRRNATDGINQIRQADLSWVYPWSPRWSLVGRYYYSLLDRRPLELLGGVQWDSCCVAMRFLARHNITNRDGKMGNSIQFELILKGLSSVGQNTDHTLRRAILGYVRDDLYLVPPSSPPPPTDPLDPHPMP